MQEKSSPLHDARRGSGRSNADRSANMRADLLACARTLFVTKGYAETSTPEIVAAAGVTRGALYHHFADKQALFRAVIEAEAEAVARHIVADSGGITDSRLALLAGSKAYFTAMRQAGRCRLLLIDGPAILGPTIMQQIDAAQGGNTVLDGLRTAQQAGHFAALPLQTLAALVSGLFDRAALMIDQGSPADEVEQSVTALLEGLWRQS